MSSMNEVAKSSDAAKPVSDTKPQMPKILFFGDKRSHIVMFLGNHEDLEVRMEQCMFGNMLPSATLSVEDARLQLRTALRKCFNSVEAEQMNMKLLSDLNTAAHETFGTQQKEAEPNDDGQCAELTYYRPEAQVGGLCALDNVCNFRGEPTCNVDPTFRCSDCGSRYCIDHATNGYIKCANPYKRKHEAKN